MYALTIVFSKGRIIENLLNIINYMYTNPTKSGKNVYKNMDAQLFQINATAEKHFQTQSKNILTVKNNTHKDITLNQTLSKEHWHKELQQHRDVENRSIDTIENQLIEFR